MSEIQALTDQAITAAQAGRDAEVMTLLGRIVPTYKRSEPGPP